MDNNQQLKQSISREQLEEQRRKKIDELKTRDLERRNAVHERKRLIWEAEQNRKEAMLRRNVEIESKLEAKRIAQRNASSFVFGSSTPRTINLDMAALGTNRLFNTVLFSAAPAKPSPQTSDNIDTHTKRRPVSAYYSDENTINDITPVYSPFMNTGNARSLYHSALYSNAAKACLTMTDDLNGSVNAVPVPGPGENLMSQSLSQSHVASPFGGAIRGRKRHTELTPFSPRERDFTCSTTRINKDCGKGNDVMIRSVQKRAVSMTRLDQLALPRRRYTEDDLKSAGNFNNNMNADNVMAKSMCNLSAAKPNVQRHSVRKVMSTSMMQLANNSNKINNNNNNKHNAHHRVGKSAHTQFPSPLSPINKEMSKSMGHLSTAKHPPRQTRASKLRTENSMRLAKSSMTLTDDIRSRDNPLSPTRPISSMSVPSENTEPVKMRAKPAISRKPRPVSIAGVSADRKSENIDMTSKRESRSIEKRSAPIPALRFSRARSAGASPRPGLSLASPDIENKYAGAMMPKPTLPKKPAHVKAAAAARKAAKQTPPVNDVTLQVKEQHTPQKDDDSENIQNSSLKLEPELPKSKDNCLILNSDNDTSPSSNKKEISDDEYKKVLAEKRKLAREIAERDAEIERQRIEKQRIEEEERIKREEEEQRRMEEEQIRLLEEHKKIEEEKLRKAIEEQRLKEEEENRRKEEEARIRAEREEKEKKMKEEAEKQRLELEERLKKDEEERLARKKKLEAIMSRTRKTPNAKSGSPVNSPNETPEPQLSDSNGSSSMKSREEAKNIQNSIMNEQIMEQKLLIDATGDSTQLKPDLVEDVNRAAMQQQMISHVNGGSYHRNNDSLSPGAHLDAAVGNIIDFNGLNSISLPSQSTDTSLDQLINLNFSSSNSLESNNDDVNSNRIVSSDAFIPINNQFSSNDTQKKSHEQAITDLLS